MKPRPAAVPPLPQPAYAVWVGIDPGATVGMVGLVVPMVGAFALDIDRAKLIGTASVSASTSVKYTRASARATLLLRVRRVLVQWGATHVVLEEPADAARAWIGAQGQKGKQATGTGFYLGAHFGLCLGAAATMPAPPRMFSHPVTSSKRARANQDADAQLGWMQGRASRPTKREDTLDRCTILLRQLAQRPADGKLPGVSALTEYMATVQDHQLMALGVLNFHLLRERGKV